MKSQKEKTFESILQDNRDRLYRLCRGFLGNSEEVDDLFQEILLKVWRNLENFRGDAHINTWVYRIATNTALLYRKKSQQYKDRRAPDEAWKDMSIEESVVEAVATEDDISRLLYAISQLKKQERIIITMVLEGFSYKEIAEVSGISINYVGVKVNRVKSKLNKQLTQKKNARTI